MSGPSGPSLVTPLVTSLTSSLIFIFLRSPVVGSGPAIISLIIPLILGFVPLVSGSESCHLLLGLVLCGESGLGLVQVDGGY